MGCALYTLLLLVVEVSEGTNGIQLVIIDHSFIIDRKSVDIVIKFEANWKALDLAYRLNIAIRDLCELEGVGNQAALTNLVLILIFPVELDVLEVAWIT